MPTSKTFETRLETTPDLLFSWHARPGAFDRLRPPWQRLEITQPAPLENGSRVKLRLKKGPVWLSWTAEHRDVVEGQGFTDFQKKGPFALWHHRHEFEAAPGGGTLLRDRIEYALPGGPLGALIGGPAVEKDLDSTFAYRHATTARDLERHALYAKSPRLRIAVTGASGLVGSNLVPFLSTGGHEVLAVRRGSREHHGDAGVRWSPDQGLLEPESIDPFDAVVHLAGENIASGRWTPERKARIRDSRVEGTRNLVRSLGRLKHPPRTLVCASAIGFYGSRGAENLDENSGSGEGFLADTAVAWEAAARDAETYGIRVVLLRLGIVLSPAGGALAKMLPPFRLGAGGRVGAGDQFMSWISIDDAVGVINAALLTDDLEGPVNAVGPEPVTNSDFTGTLGRVLGRPTLFPLPGPAARALFGEMADEMLLSSTKVTPAKLLQTGFHFKDSKLEGALLHVLGRNRLP